jgi:hypothetical protein
VIASHPFRFKVSHFFDASWCSFIGLDLGVFKVLHGSISSKTAEIYTQNAAKGFDEIISLLEKLK